MRTTSTEWKKSAILSVVPVRFGFKNAFHQPKHATAVELRQWLLVFTRI